MAGRIAGLRYDALPSRVELVQLLSHAELLLKANRVHADALSVRAWSLHHLDRGGEAIDAARVAVQRVTNRGQLGALWNDFHRIANADGTRAQDDSVFTAMKNNGYAATYAWTLHGTHLEQRLAWAEAAAAHARAFELSNDYEEYACRAGRSYWSADQDDNALKYLRACLSANAVSTFPDTSNIVYAHRGIASILNTRGVYSQAELHARQALGLSSGTEGAYSALELAKALLEQQRPSEALTAAETAVRLGDGSITATHFVLGRIYFKLEQWPRCTAAFRLADQQAPTPNSAYNLALCLVRQSYFREAARWMETVLQRDPRRSDKADIQAMIRLWRSQ